MNLFSRGGPDLMSTSYDFCLKSTGMQSISVANNICTSDYPAATLNGNTNNLRLSQIMAWRSLVITAENLET